MRPRVSVLALGLVALAGCDAPDAEDASVPEDAATEDASAPDAAGPVDASERGPTCDPQAPTCAADEKCTTIRWDLAGPWPPPRCTPIDPDGASTGNACFALEGVFDTCNADDACTNYGTGEGYCVPTCRAPGTLCDGAPDLACVTVDPSSGFALCLRRCDTEDDCDAPALMQCVERDGFRVCDARAG